jgi:hypothetical protein
VDVLTPSEEPPATVSVVSAISEVQSADVVLIGPLSVTLGVPLNVTLPITWTGTGLDAVFTTVTCDVPPPLGPLASVQSRHRQALPPQLTR